jgi:hypothetical protein
MHILHHCNHEPALSARIEKTYLGNVDNKMKTRLSKSPEDAAKQFSLVLPRYKSYFHNTAWVDFRFGRMLDKGRATLAGKNGEYIYNSPTDQRLVQFLGFDPDALLKELATGKSDGKMLEWVEAHSKTPRSPWEIEAWSAFMEKRAPDSDAETLAFFAEHLGRLSKTREDVKTLFEFGELDDYVSFGGKA